MGDVSITVVVPTLGRPTLVRTLKSLQGQDWGRGDGALVVADGPGTAVEEIWSQFDLPGRFVQTPRNLGHWGHGVRNWVQDTHQIKSTHRAQLDDDDVWTPGALKTIKDAVRKHNRPRAFLFQMDWSRAGRIPILFEEEVVREGNVGTPMLVAPSDWVAKWGTRYAGDFDHIRETCNRDVLGPVWVREVICVCRPHLPVKGVNVSNKRYKLCSHAGAGLHKHCGDCRRTCGLGLGTDGTCRITNEMQDCTFYEVKVKPQFLTKEQRASLQVLPPDRPTETPSLPETDLVPSAGSPDSSSAEPDLPAAVPESFP